MEVKRDTAILLAVLIGFWSWLYTYKKDAYTYLDLKIEATPDGVDIKGYLDSSVISGDSCLLTIGQTSPCLLFSFTTVLASLIGR
ncbi:hypothetical protein ACFLXJ_04605 [Chloroflexota bacterium]